VQDLARWGSRLAPLSNWVARSFPARWLNEQVLGLDRRRKPPAWASTTFASRLARRSVPLTANTAYVFNDTFTNYYNPEVGLAGVSVLEGAGVPVALAPNRCCGRPLISQGLLDEARELATVNTVALYPLAEQGGSLVFFEPSCLSAVREDHPSLLRGDLQRQARRVSEAAFLFEEFLERRWASGHTRPPFEPGPAKILLHGHCHQKAMGLLAPARSILSRIPGSTVVDLDAGCCGMAGSFGYLRDHFDVSRAIGERRLLPAARTVDRGSVLVASGVSCRHQVEDFTGTQAVHPAQLLASLLSSPLPEPA
jgi:Fe-S oxidoreductase